MRRLHEAHLSSRKHTLISVQGRSGIADEAVKIANVGEQPISIMPRLIGNLFLLNLFMKGGRLLECCNGALMIELGPGHAGGRNMRLSLGDTPCYQIARK